jgi:acetyl-CoA C-acetyltransferase
MTQVIILSATRTPLGSFRGVLSGVPAPSLGAAAIRGAVAQAKIDGKEVTDAIMGNVLQAGLGQAPARQAAILAGLPSSARCATVNKVCGSGILAVMNGAHALAAGHSRMVVAGGMENMSASPYLLPGARAGYRMGNQQAIDSMVHDGLWDPYSNSHMGSCAEECAKKYGYSREQQDAYAIASFQRANSAQASGLLDSEISPVMTRDARGAETSIGRDEAPDRVNYSKIPTLRPAFDGAGTITAANASSISDGAAALVLTTSDTANARGLKPIGRLVSFGSHSQEPLWFTTAPVRAAQTALQGAGWSAADVDLWEVNEAFAVVPMAFMQELGLPHDRLNVRGGAISLGHPIGASGARILVTLLAALRERGLRRGVAAICIGGGEAIAACVELIA